MKVIWESEGFLIDMLFAYSRILEIFATYMKIFYFFVVLVNVYLMYTIYLMYHTNIIDTFDEIENKTRES